MLTKCHLFFSYFHLSNQRAGTSHQPLSYLTYTFTHRIICVHMTVHSALWCMNNGLKLPLNTTNGKHKKYHCIHCRAARFNRNKPMFELIQNAEAANPFVWLWHVIQLNEQISFDSVFFCWSSSSNAHANRICLPMEAYGIRWTCGRLINLYIVHEIVRLSKLKKSQNTKWFLRRRARYKVILWRNIGYKLILCRRVRHTKEFDKIWFCLRSNGIVINTVCNTVAVRSGAQNMANGHFLNFISTEFKHIELYLSAVWLLAFACHEYEYYLLRSVIFIAEYSFAFSLTLDVQ